MKQEKITFSDFVGSVQFLYFWVTEGNKQIITIEPVIASLVKQKQRYFRGPPVKNSHYQKRSLIR